MPISKGIPEGKKRYTLTLTETTVNRVHAWLGRNRAPKSVLSTMVDEYLTDCVNAWDEMEKVQRQKGSEVEIGEFFQVLGKVISDKRGDQLKLE